MTRLLASVKNLAEAKLALAGGADIIDLKDPEQGSLGALLPDQVKAVVQMLNRQVLCSATIGDLPMEQELIIQQTALMATTGVDYIKIGFWLEYETLPAILAALTPLTSQVRLIAVIFADRAIDLNLLTQFKKANFAGLMLDTFNKTQGSLVNVKSLSELAHFVQITKQLDLLCGLAGSLKVADIPDLLNLKADYLGFRGALCEDHKRTAAIHPEAVRTIKNLIPPIFQ